jgi:hypothetical protein
VEVRETYKDSRMASWYSRMSGVVSWGEAMVLGEWVAYEVGFLWMRRGLLKLRLRSRRTTWCLSDRWMVTRKQKLSVLLWESQVLVSRIRWNVNWFRRASSMEVVA